MNNIILIVGASGSGKSTVAGILEKKYGLKQMKSYTTRPPRYKGEDGHIFVSEKEFRKLKKEMCAYTKFDGHEYGCLNSQIEQSDIFVIDVEGISYFRKHYKGTKTPLVVWLHVENDTAYRRMTERGDTPEYAMNRIIHDEGLFDESVIFKLPFDVDTYYTDRKSAEEIAADIISQMEVRNE